jgi:2-deoxy-D-gluconate 3-dehydrogenase
MILNQFNLENKVAVVVGGTGGLGSALSLGLAEAGADVLATSRNAAKVDDVTKKIELLGRKTFSIRTDATNEEDMRLLCNKSLDFYGKVDILVNAVGINIRKTVLEMTYEDWSTVLRANLDSVFLGAKYFARNMIKENYGKIINIGSLNSVIASTNLCAYAASKGGVVQLSKALAVELSEYNINVNVILPGYFDTELTESVIKNKMTYGRIVERTPMKRIGTVEELKGAAVFLASDASQFITGETLAVDGGFLSFGVDLS